VKLCLNSLWGKLCENPKRTQKQLISEPQDLFRFLATPGIEVASLLFAGNTVCWISWRHANEAHVAVLRHTNDVIACYVTAGGRMKLYTYLDILQRRALYADTDSVIYIQPRDGAANTFQNILAAERKIIRTKRAIQRQARRQPCVRCEVLH